LQAILAILLLLLALYLIGEALGLLLTSWVAWTTGLIVVTLYYFWSARRKYRVLDDSLLDQAMVTVDVAGDHLVVRANQRRLSQFWQTRSFGIAGIAIGVSVTAPFALLIAVPKIHAAPQALETESIIRWSLMVVLDCALVAWLAFHGARITAATVKRRLDRRIDEATKVLSGWKEVASLIKEADEILGQFGLAADSWAMDFIGESTWKTISSVLRDRASATQALRSAVAFTRDQLAQLRHSANRYASVERQVRIAVDKAVAVHSHELVYAAEEVGRDLCGDEMIGLLKERRWGEFNTSCEEMANYLLSVQDLAEESASRDTGGRGTTDSGLDRHAMTRADAARLLGVESDDPPEKVQSSFRKMAAIVHPDPGGAYASQEVAKAKEEWMKQLIRARAILTSVQAVVG
jgi:hypothetical protein